MKKPAVGKRGSAQSFDEQLRFAIAHKRLLRVTYDNAARLGEPHDYGIQYGIPRLLFYQIERIDRSRDARKETSGWRMLDLENISDCAVTEKTFPGSRGDSHQQHLTWDKLFARVTPPDSGNPGKSKRKR